ncbi:hypothetical protein ACF1HJ_06085 [Streptomyces sp. NPDC013978]|uniref:hypothetical protein n=1 Tax=Streptomyces sp. NPDC013978 TaxID=3364869 RepID=UPI0036FA46A5
MTGHDSRKTTIPTLDQQKSIPEVPKFAVAIAVLLASTVAVTDQPRPMVTAGFRLTWPVGRRAL